MSPPAKNFGTPATPLPSRRPVLLPHMAPARRRPAFHSGKLFTLGISGVVAAFDAANGKLLWRTDAPAEHPYFSAAASPVGEKDLVITHPGNYGPLTAFDVHTGVI